MKITISKSEVGYKNHKNYYSKCENPIYNECVSFALLWKIVNFLLKQVNFTKKFSPCNTQLKIFAKNVTIIWRINIYCTKRAKDV